MIKRTKVNNSSSISKGQSTNSNFMGSPQLPNETEQIHRTFHSPESDTDYRNFLQNKLTRIKASEQVLDQIKQRIKSFH